MLRDAFWNLERAHFLSGNLFRVSAHHEMDFVRAGVDLIEQSLQINRAAGTGGRDDKFHRRRV